MILIHYKKATDNIKGFKELYQPLDRKIFGPIKAKARKLFRLQQVNGEPLNQSKKTACQSMIAAWEGVTSVQIASAWDIYM